MKKRQWRMLITEILETRNEANTQHAFIENRLAEMNVQLDAIRRRLPPEPVELECVLSGDGEPLPPISDAPPTQEPFNPHTSTWVAPTVDYANLRWRAQNEDGTWRDCID